VFDDKNYIAVAGYLQSLQDFTFLWDRNKSHIGILRPGGKAPLTDQRCQLVGEGHDLGRATDNARMRGVLTPGGFAVGSAKPPTRAETLHS
jgi:hypothetical protein